MSTTTTGRDPIWRKALGALGIDVRHGEGAVAILLFLFFFVAITFQYISKAVRQSKFMDSLGAEMLPIVYLLLAACALPAILLYNRAVDRMQRHHVIAGTCAVVAASIVGFAFVIESDAPWVPIAFYVWISIAYVMIVSQFWAYSNYVLDPRQGKRLFGFIGAGGLTGGLTGASIASFVSGAAGTRATLMVSAAVLTTAIAIIYVVHRMAPVPAEERPDPQADKLAVAKGGLRTILASRHLTLIASLMFLTVVVANIIDLQFNWAMVRAVPDDVIVVDANTAWDARGDLQSLVELLAAAAAGTTVEIEGTGVPQDDGSIVATGLTARLAGGAAESPPEAGETAATPGESAAVPADPRVRRFGADLTGVELDRSQLSIEPGNRLDALTGGYGDFYVIMSISALIFQLLFTSRIHRKLGVGFAMRVLPVTMALGTTGIFVAATVVPAALLSVCLLLKVGENGLRYSLDQATRELLFFPVPTADRLKAKAYIDVFIQRSAKAGAGLLTLPVALGLMTVLNAGWISFVLIAMWLVVTIALRREYVVSFRDGLRRRAVDARMPVDLTDVTSLEVLVETLGSSDKREVLHALELLEYFDKEHLVPPLLAQHDSPEVRQKTLELIARGGRVEAISTVEKVLGDENPQVRSAALHALVALHGSGATTEMADRLADTDPGVRATAIASILASASAGQNEAERALEEMVASSDASNRCRAADVMGELPEPLFQEELVQLLYDPDIAVQRDAIRAVHARVGRDVDNPLFAPTLISLMRDRRLKHEAREALVAYGVAVIPALVHFMNDTQEQMWVRRAIPKTVAQIGGESASRALLASLDASDRFLRQKVVESLSWMRANDPRSTFAEDVVAEQIRHEARLYFLALTDLISTTPTDNVDYHAPLASFPGDRPLLLQRLLADDVQASVRNIFGLLGLVHPIADVRAARESLLSGDARLRSHALEYLDNALQGEVHRAVFTVIGDVALDEKLELARTAFDLAVQPPEDVVRRLVMASSTPDEAAHWLGAAAIHAIYELQLADLYPQLQDAARRRDDSMAQETASWAAARLGFAPS